MKEFILKHYWMTFWIIIFFIYFVGTTINNILIIINNKIIKNSSYDELKKMIGEIILNKEKKDNEML